MNTVSRFFTLCLWSATALICMPALCLADSKVVLQGPHVYKNLSIYLVRGADSVDTKNIITLDEAIEGKLIRVHETGSVNELRVENRSKDKTIFIQAGDIVKGGQQDRTLSSDLLLKPQSGKVSLEAFCVEHSRWNQRGSEPVKEFSSAKASVPSKAMKVAAAFEKKQDKVWNEVANLQRKLSANLGKSVAAPESVSSLQLTLEDKDVNMKAGEYRTALESIISTVPDSLGFVYAVNGELSSADVYASNALFRAVWPRLLTAAANEALADERKELATALADTAVEQFLATAENGKARPTEGGVAATIRESEKTYFAESYLTKKEAKWVHRAYVTK